MINIQIFHNIFVNVVSLWAGFGVVVPSKYTSDNKVR